MWGINMNFYSLSELNKSHRSLKTDQMNTKIYKWDNLHALPAFAVLHIKENIGQVLMFLFIIPYPSDRSYNTHKLSTKSLIG